jgi:outer membrane lipoprotein-sorting protein
MMKALTIRTVLLSLIFWLAPLPSPAGERPQGLDSETLRIIEQIKRREASLRNFSARFEQIQKTRLFAEVVRSEGTIFYDAQGKLHFQVTSPAPLSILFDGEWVVVHDPEQGRTQRRHVGKRQNLLKSYFGLGQPVEDLVRRFDVKAAANAPLPGVTLRMIPRQDRLAKHVQLISAEVDDNSWLPRQIYFQRSETEWSRIHLKFTSIDQTLPADAFDVPGAGAPSPAAPKESP